MAIDHGDARIGLALSDSLGLFAQPLATIENKGKKSLSDILSIAAANQVSDIIVGLPYELDGSVGVQAQKVKKFADRRRSAISKGDAEIGIIMWDERFTSAQAERIIAGSSLKNSDRHAAVDRVSAALLLESYLSKESGDISV